jgi:hypothetical protein
MSSILPLLAFEASSAGISRSVVVETNDLPSKHWQKACILAVQTPSQVLLANSSRW